ncbi:MAG: 2'-5' RNA ligase family protein [Novosphingobium sp.]|nr:2'-5' RNA ligase family protein [Novosphingobium sp.]
MAGKAFEPFIVTAQLPADLFAWADGLRRAHFPPERNHLQAHVTLFHAFAPSLFEELKRVLPVVAREYGPPPARLDGLMDLGKGTALAIESRGMLAIREAIADRFHGALTAQDRHEPRLHITIQNKVTREEARALQDELSDRIAPRDFRFRGLEMHIYRGGPWEFVHRWAFRGAKDG